MEEYYDVLDVFRRPTGRVRSRGEALQEDEYRSGAEIWVFNADGRLMVTRRHLKKDKHPGKWECTGGLVRAGESTFATIIREAEEEIGILFAPDEIRRVATRLCGHEYLDIYTAHTDRIIESLKLQPEEVIDARYVTWDELRAMRDSGEFISAVYERIIEFRSLL